MAYKTLYLGFVKCQMLATQVLIFAGVTAFSR
jgi:hypothetical protein